MVESANQKKTPNSPGWPDDDQAHAPEKCPF
jgi:hypothetical protein